MTIEQGLFNAVLLDGKGGGAELDWDGVNQWSPEQGFLWINLDYSNEFADHWISGKSDLDPLIAEVLTSEVTRPRSLSSHDGLLVVMRGVNLNPNDSPEDMVSVRMWIEEKRIITTRHRELLSLAEIAQLLKKGDGPSSSGEFLTMLAWRMTDRMADVVEEISDRMDDLEELVVSAESHGLRKELSTARRQSISFRRYLTPQREAFNRLYNEKTSWLNDMDRLQLREIADRTTRLVEDLDEVRDRAAVTHEELGSRLAEQLNNRMYVLSIVAAIFLPLGFLTGLLGINVGGIPGTDNKSAFLIVCLALAVVAAGIGIAFKIKKWF